MRKMIFGLLGSALLAGCSSGADVTLAEGEIAKFHQQLNAGQFDAIYANANAQLKTATPQVELVQLLSAVQRKLGVYQTGQSAGWNDNMMTSGHFVTVNYSATYARGAAQENFVYRVDDKGASLVGYHINSTALILN